MNLFDFASSTGLKYDQKLGIVYGRYNGYKVVIQIATTPYRIVLSVTNGGTLAKDLFKTMDKKIANVVECQYYRLVIASKSAMKADSRNQNLLETLDYVTEWLKANGFQNCSELSGEVSETGVYYVSGTFRILSAEDYAKLSQNHTELANQQDSIQEKVFLGTFGAILGSLVGVFVILILNKIGLVAGIGGTVMSFCAVMGYEKLGKKLTKKSKFIIFAIIIVMCLVANHLCWASSFYDVFKDRYALSFGQVLEMTSDLIKTNDLFGEYMLNLGLILLFTLLGAVPTLNRSVNNAVNANVLYVVEEAPERYSEY